jgi:exopolysaccharide biosynthesis polyprenyl glycosylphosphotransferase
VLQRSSTANLRRHSLRLVARVGSLLLLDFGGFLIARWALTGLRDGAWVASSIAASVTSHLPTGYLGGTQFFLALVVGLAATRAYGMADQWRDPTRILFGVGLAVGLALWSTLWQESLGVGILRFVVTTLALGLLMIALRGIASLGLQAVRRSGRYQVRSLLVVDPEAFPPPERTPLFGRDSAFRLVRRISAPATSVSADSLEAYEHVLASAIQEEQAETVFVAGSLSNPVLASTADIASASGAELVGLSRLGELPGVSPRYAVIEGVGVTHLTQSALKGHQRLLKRVVDLMGAGIGLVVLSPLLLTLGAAVRITSHGPAFFRQERVGLGGRTFRMYKFRSMSTDAESRRGEIMPENIYADARLFKLEGDPRVTPLGRFLRRFSLDELPQLLNVLKGEMSLVGPRPPIPSEVALYEGHHYCRFDMPPGMTGPWQVNGRNEITDFEEVVLLERNYIRNWSVWLDLKLLLETIPTVLKGTGAH